MKSAPSTVAVGDTQVESRWGFDLLRPAGLPQAWIQDWDQPAPGFGVSEGDAGLARSDVDDELGRHIVA